MVQTPAVYCIVDNEVPNISNHQPCDRTLAISSPARLPFPALPAPAPHFPRPRKPAQSPSAGRGAPRHPSPDSAGRGIAEAEDCPE